MIRTAGNCTDAHAAARYHLATKARLVFDPARAQPILLYPERGLALNDLAAVITRMCVRGASLADLVAGVRERHPEMPAEAVERDVHAFLAELEARGLLRLEP